jgi:uncharacterized 2Fe-2S/4Fe-4S cluster protein (DUF4445 family)
MTPDIVKIRLEPLAVEVCVPRGAELIGSLADHGVEFPCGGAGNCGGCSVRVLSGSLPIRDADREVFTGPELEEGWRLACQARANEPLVLECGQWKMDVLADANALAAPGKSGLGIAIDLGTTTIAAQMVDLATGIVLGVETALNPQARFGADVMSRVRAVLEGNDLTAMMRATLGALVARLAGRRKDEVTEVVLVGNTVMHHLFSGCDLEPLSHVPFASPHLAARHFKPSELGWELPSGCVVRFERCLGGFVGSDILAGIVAVEMGESEELIALVDLGTNGEIAIGNHERIVCASTAAGPAFEAGSIRMGMRAVTGAISHVARVANELRATVIGDVEPRGICGSGLVDAVAAGLSAGDVVESGRIADGTKKLQIAGTVVLHQADIRELQLAKGAIAAGFRILLRKLGAEIGAVRKIYLAGAFGNYVRIESAIRIGLIEAPLAIVHAAGNTALRGAKSLLASEEPVLPVIEHISLAADPHFQDEFVAAMSFPLPSSRT